MLAYRYRTNESTLMKGNCLRSKVLRVGQVLYVPNTPPRPPCGPPPGWVVYTIRSGDTLSGLASYYGISVETLSRPTA